LTLPILSLLSCRVWRKCRLPKHHWVLGVEPLKESSFSSTFEVLLDVCARLTVQRRLIVGRSFRIHVISSWGLALCHHDSHRRDAIKDSLLEQILDIVLINFLRLCFLLALFHQTHIKSRDSFRDFLRLHLVFVLLRRDFFRSLGSDGSPNSSCLLLNFKVSNLTYLYSRSYSIARIHNPPCFKSKSDVPLFLLPGLLLSLLNSDEVGSGIKYLLKAPVVSSFLALVRHDQMWLFIKSLVRRNTPLRNFPLLLL